jgi:hypothetical protein
MNMLAIAMAALVGLVQFPMESTGRLGVFKFFTSDVEHFVWSEIAARVTAMRAGRFETRLGLEMDTYMGESWNNPDMKFNIYGGHWNITFELAWLTGWGETRLYTDHECFHNIDMEDTLSEYMNNIKLGAVWYPDSFDQPDGFDFLPAGRPCGWLSLGLYRPRGDGFQKGHDFDWSIQGQADMPLAAWHRWTGGLRYRPEVFFHEDGDVSTRQRIEAYTRYTPGRTAVEFHLTHFPVDTQPFRQLEGETYAGLRFLW